MKTLILMRHSHAEIDGRASTDFERELTDSGRTLAQQTANLLLEFRIDMIVSSSAVRTTQTTLAMCRLFLTMTCIWHLLRLTTP